MILETTRYTLVKRSALFIFITISLATALRPLVAEQSMLFTLIGAANALVAGCVFAYISLSKPREYFSYLVIVTGFIALIPLLVVSGGVNSQFAVIIPITPVIVCLIAGAKATIVVTVFVISLILALLFLEPVLPNFAQENVSQSKTYARTFWLCLTSLLSTAFGLEFDRLSSKLGLKLQQQASMDDLTGVYNRRSVIEFLEAALFRGQESQCWLTVMMLDVDNFKHINDAYGHMFGDECLKQVAQTVQQSIRHQSDVLGRYGGEEFLIVLPEADQSNALKIAEKTRKAVQGMALEFRGQPVNLTVTIGYCSELCKSCTTVEGLLAKADDALYAGKEKGRNQVVGAEQGSVISAKLHVPEVPSDLPATGK